MGSEQNRFPQQEGRKRWGGCWSAFSCFGSQKGGKRIVPASRIPESNGQPAQPNGPPAVRLTNQATGLAPSLLAPPSSPTSFTHSALPSTAQSPSCFLSLSANSPGGPSSTMFATGPYAHETQLVSPPVFSTFTTEPSTAPLTPPPELAHLTTPSSPDVPFAHFLSSSVELRNGDKTNYIATNDLQATYSLYPGSPASSLLSPKSRNSGDGLSSSFPEREFPPQWDPSLSPKSGTYQSPGSRRLSGQDTNGVTMASQDSNFFCPATYAQFYLDQNPPFPHNGGRLSVSKDSDFQSTGGNGHQNIHSRSPKQDVEEIEAYRASFGFSADEIITTPQYVEISDVMDDSFTMTPFTSSKSAMEESTESPLMKGFKAQETPVASQSRLRLESGYAAMDGRSQHPLYQGYEDIKSQRHSGNSCSGASTPGNATDVFFKMGSSRVSKKHEMGLSCSDAEIDYRRGRSLRERKGNGIWHD
ncbi:uncharacterized protein At1g76660 [Neltuma alba]|uniref:uncharacterized protein At1g76660 n=1 Tax=Neltuma alba TaxID=207710 RepID=UPI0010A315AF|nr:uncharacterized protein At1g76660-like [Prosopis alba]XP_028784646.1 uncharacterized protein At1g76660-like [Prosopis alba]XP_028784647.1 uncharacterized protein At1g76660-like [Prosopis alba]